MDLVNVVLVEPVAKTLVFRGTIGTDIASVVVVVGKEHNLRRM